MGAGGLLYVIVGGLERSVELGLTAFVKTWALDRKN